ncbi:ImmA/IrrE family metallo-endopeptidase [Selenomonas ruminantium]|uniref:ImmA/IrrE family metallo-endopeptidase n=1 Tax=Selenomonas ruminantium TaxID=971 RepID=UPI0026F28398|nr:ImmA/IrrE family metallo-endopeptidase [Selenomonas ruminantium]
MVKTTELEKITKDEGIIIGYENFPAPIKGIYIRDNKMPIIGLDTRLDPIEKRCILAEEIGHHFTLSDGMDLREAHRYGILEKRRYYETRARAYAALLLMPQDQWRKEINKKNVTLEGLMSTFMVTKEMIIFRIIVSQMMARKIKATKRYQAKQKKLQRKRQAQKIA